MSYALAASATDVTGEPSGSALPRIDSRTKSLAQLPASDQYAVATNERQRDLIDSRLLRILGNLPSYEIERMAAADAKRWDDLWSDPGAATKRYFHARAMGIQSSVAAYAAQLQEHAAANYAAGLGAGFPMLSASVTFQRAAYSAVKAEAVANDSPDRLIFADLMSTAWLDIRDRHPESAERVARLVGISAQVDPAVKAIAARSPGFYSAATAIVQQEEHTMATKATSLHNGPLSLREVADMTAALTPQDGAALAELDIFDLDKIPSVTLRNHLQEMGMKASSNDGYRDVLKKDETVSRRVEEVMIVGGRMPKADWQQAMEIASKGGSGGKVHQAKIEGQYGGKIEMVTATHVVQRSGARSVVLHDKSMVEGLNLPTASLLGKEVRIQYGSDRGEAQVMTFQQARNLDQMKAAQQYAEQNIKTPAAQKSFLKHLSALHERQAGGSGRAAPQNEPQRAQNPERAR